MPNKEIYGTCANRSLQKHRRTGRCLSSRGWESAPSREGPLGLAGSRGTWEGEESGEKQEPACGREARQMRASELSQSCQDQEACQGLLQRCRREKE